MAELYLARASGPYGFNKLYVIKLVLPHLTDDERFVSMFLHEARLLANLDHTHIAQVIDIGEFEGDPYFVMQYVHGRDLRKVMRALSGQPLDLAVALRVASSVASGLAYAHGRTDEHGQPLGLVHRDVSPANVMIGYRGDIKLVDFGVAKSAVQDEDTRAGVIKGKAAYMSPEQCRGRKVDHRTDVFALGILLYEMTTGRRLFQGNSDFVMMQQIVEGRVPSPHDVCDDYPPDLAGIVLRALHPDPEQRTADAATLLDELEQFSRRYDLLASELDIANLMEGLFDVPSLEATALEATNAKNPLVLPTGAGQRHETSATGLGEVDAAVAATPYQEASLEEEQTIARLAPLTDRSGETTVAPPQTIVAQPPLPTIVAPRPASALAEAEVGAPPRRIRGTHVAALALVAAVGVGAWTLSTADRNEEATPVGNVVDVAPENPPVAAEAVVASPDLTEPAPAPAPPAPVEVVEVAPDPPDPGDAAPTPIADDSSPGQSSPPRPKKRPRKRTRRPSKSKDGSALDSMYP